MRSLLKALAAVLAIGAPASAAAFQPPVLQGRVNDYAQLLDAGQRQALESKLRDFENRTSAQIVILTITDQQGLELASFSQKTFSDWKLGQKGVDNGLLITYSTAGDHFRIEVGYGLEGAIPDGKAGEILRRDLRGHANPRAGTRDFYGAFDAATGSVMAIIAAEVAKDPSGASLRKREGNVGSIVLALILGLVITVICGVINPVFGAVIGGVAGAVLAFVGSFATPWFVLTVLIGVIIGALSKAIGESGGSGGGGFFSAVGDGASAFAGGGGDCGGGGAGD